MRVHHRTTGLSHARPTTRSDPRPGKPERQPELAPAILFGPFISAKQNLQPRIRNAQTKSS